MPPIPHVDPTQIDWDHTFADTKAIESYNPQRYQMLQLDRIILMDRENDLVIAAKQVRPNEFWVEGHMPGFPIFPGVLMCEAAAQLASYYVKYHKFMDEALMGLGGLEETRFRSPVYPGDRLMLIGKAKKVDRRKTVFDVQGFVGSLMVFHTIVLGVVIPAKT